MASQDETSDAQNDLLDENAKLRDSLTLLQGQLEDTNDKLEHLRSQLELRSSRASFVTAAHVQDLEVQIKQLTVPCVKISTRKLTSLRANATSK